MRSVASAVLETICRAGGYPRSGCGIFLVLLGLPACGLENAVDAWNAKPMEELSTGEASTSGAGESGGSSGGTDGDEGASTALVSATTSTGAETDGLTSGSTSPSESTGEPAGCGPEAECDDAKQANCFNCARDRLVFVTSEQYQGDFGSMPGLDDRCNQLADKAGLLIGKDKRFNVWISTSDVDAIDRFYHSPGRYVLVNGEIFAESWEAIVAGELLHPLNIDENGAEHNSIVWTDTRPDGRKVAGSTHCDDWSSSELSTEANYGYSSESDGQWTHVVDGTSPTYCTEVASLYCIEFV